MQASKADNKNIFRVEVGVLLTDKSYPGYNYYAKVYDHKYGYYDEDQYYEQNKEKALAYIQQYVADGVNMTYGVIAVATLDDNCFKNGKLKKDIEIENEDYHANNIIFSIAKINGKIVKDFMQK